MGGLDPWLHLTFVLQRRCRLDVASPANRLSAWRQPPQRTVAPTWEELYTGRRTHVNSVASDTPVMLLQVKHEELSRSVHHSMRHGAARVLDQSTVFSDDARTHAERLTAIAVHAARTDDDRSWDQVVNGLSRLVFDMAVTYFKKWSSHLPAHASFDDVFMAGMEGLTIGVRKFDPARGFMLSTYVQPWIRTKVQRACYAQCGAMKIPETMLQAGIDMGSPLLGSSMLSLDFRAPGERDTLGEGIEGDDVIAQTEERIGEMDGVRRVLELLGEVDVRLPEIARLAGRGYTDREVGRIVGISGPQVKHLRGLAAEALVSAGLA